MFRAGFQNGHMADGVKCLVPAWPVTQRSWVGPFLSFGGFVHDELPSARGNLRVSGRQIRAGDLQIDGRLLGWPRFSRAKGASPLRGRWCASLPVCQSWFLCVIIPPLGSRRYKSESLSHNVISFICDEVRPVRCPMLTGRELVAHCASTVKPLNTPCEFYSAGNFCWHLHVSFP